MLTGGTQEQIRTSATDRTPLVADSDVSERPTLFDSRAIAHHLNSHRKYLTGGRPAAGLL